MHLIRIPSLFDTQETIADKLLANILYPWEVLPKIHDFILELGPTLPKEDYEQIEDKIWIAKDVSIDPTAHISGPAIIDHRAEIRHCAFLRGNVIIGKQCVVGNSTEIKNALLFNKVEVPHFNYVGDSILGYKAHMGAGAVTSNIKSDKSEVTARVNGEVIQTGLVKLGAILGDHVEIGCNSVLNPGTIIGKGSRVYPCLSVRGFVEGDCIYKGKDQIVKKEHFL